MRNSHGIHEERWHVLLSQSSVATPALFRSRVRFDARSVHVPATFYVPDNGGCSQATAWMLRLIESFPGLRAFPPFFLSSSKGDRRYVVEDVGWPPRRPPERCQEKKYTPFASCPSPPVETTDTRTQSSAYAHAHASDRTCIRECSALSLRFIIGSRPDITTRTLLIGRRNANEPTPLIPIHPYKNYIG